jgi:hypothetical protein
LPIHKTCVSFLCAIGLVGCSADPYRAPTPAPPDRLHAFAPPPPITPLAEALNWGTSGCVPIGDGNGDLAPNYSGYVPRLTSANLGLQFQVPAQDSNHRSILTRAPEHPALK